MPTSPVSDVRVPVAVLTEWPGSPVTLTIRAERVKVESVSSSTPEPAARPIWPTGASMEPLLATDWPSRNTEPS
jgi:hypothetical protein